MNRIERIYIGSVAAVLGFTAAFKILTLLYANAAMSSVSDPLFNFVSLRTLTAIAAVFELTIACFLASKLDVRQRLWAIAWTAAVFLAYHAALLIIGYKGNCICLGKASTWMSVSKNWHIGPTVIYSLLAYMTIGSFGLLLLEFTKAKIAESQHET